MTSRAITYLSDDLPPRFPDPAGAMRTPNGLLAAGGALTPEWLLEAYTCGIFPWFGQDEPILWWSPDPRCVFHTDRMHLGRRLRQTLRHCPWTIHADGDFESVIEACAAPRDDSPGTWLLPPMIEAYRALYRLGHAHSIEVRDGDELVGGLYGVASGRVFCGESMFSARSGGSRVALLALARVLADWGWPLLDAQVPNDHLLRLGATLLPRRHYLNQLTTLQDPAPAPASWRQAWPELRARDLA